MGFERFVPGGQVIVPFLVGFLVEGDMGVFVDENGGAMDSKAVRALQKFIDSLDVDWLLLGHEGAERR